jgi:hypothetical protein
LFLTFSLLVFVQMARVLKDDAVEEKGERFDGEETLSLLSLIWAVFCGVLVYGWFVRWCSCQLNYCWSVRSMQSET